MNLDRTFCASDVEHHTCARELSPPDAAYAKHIGKPLSFAYFCGEPKTEGASDSAQREAFEKHFENETGAIPIRCGEGYLSPATMKYYQGWQAALASLPTMTEAEFLEILSKDRATERAVKEYNSDVPGVVVADMFRAAYRAIIGRLPQIVKDV